MTNPSEPNPLVSPLLDVMVTPVGFNIGTKQGAPTDENPRGMLVVLIIHTVAGTTVVSVPPSMAKQVAANMDRIATQAAIGLHMPDDA